MKARPRPTASRPVAMARNWRALMAAACLLPGVLAGVWWHARGPRRPTLLPGGLVLEHLSAKIDLRDSRPQSPWQRYLELRQRAEALVHANGGGLCAIECWDLADPGKPRDGNRWRTVMLHHPGFAPRAVFEYPAHGGTDQLLGFFDADGRPLTVDRRRPGNDPSSGMWLLHLKPPLAPDETRPVIQVERTPTPFKDAGHGRGWDLHWPGGDNGQRQPLVQVRALRLPPDATWTLRQGTPEPDVLKGEPPVLFWLVKPGEPPPTIALTATWPDN